MVEDAQKVGSYSEPEITVYKAPEIEVKLDNFNEKTDIYSFGIVFLSLALFWI